MTETVKLEPLNLKTAVAIGYFDAVHLGHRLILDTAVRYAKEMELFPAGLPVRERRILSR